MDGGTPDPFQLPLWSCTARHHPAARSHRADSLAAGSRSAPAARGWCSYHSRGRPAPLCGTASRPSQHTPLPLHRNGRGLRSRHHNLQQPSDDTNISCLAVLHPAAILFLRQGASGSAPTGAYTANTGKCQDGAGQQAWGHTRARGMMQSPMAPVSVAPRCLRPAQPPCHPGLHRRYVHTEPTQYAACMLS